MSLPWTFKVLPCFCNCSKRTSKSDLCYGGATSDIPSGVLATYESIHLRRFGSSFLPPRGPSLSYIHPRCRSRSATSLDPRPTQSSAGTKPRPLPPPSCWWLAGRWFVVFWCSACTPSLRRPDFLTCALKEEAARGSRGDSDNLRQKTEIAAKPCNRLRACTFNSSAAPFLTTIKLTHSLLLQISSTRSQCRLRQVSRRGGTLLIWVWDRRLPLGHVYAPYSVSDVTRGHMQYNHIYIYSCSQKQKTALFSFQVISFNVLPTTHIFLSSFVSIWAPSLSLSHLPSLLYCFLFHTHTLFPFQ